MVCKECGNAEALGGEVYCRECKFLVIEAMHASGYLTPLPPATRGRSTNEKEDIRATKYGTE